MPRCEICDEVVDKVYICRECGTKFCEECGDPQNRICILCRGKFTWYEEPEEEEEEEEEELVLICEICGEEVDEVYECKECGLLFCAECGDTRTMLCELCLGKRD